MVKMKLYNTFNIKKNHKDSIILIGNFDGLHLGHQKLFRLAKKYKNCLLYTSPSPRDISGSRMPSSA